MVGQNSKIYLVTGGKPLQRHRAINSIKKKIFEKENPDLSSVTLYGKEIEIDSFKSLVFTFSFQKKRIILIKNITSLPKPVKSFLLNNFNRVLEYNYMILESETPYYSLKNNKRINSDDFFNYVFKKGIKYQGKAYPSKVNIEDFKKKMYRNDLDSCLFILEELLKTKSKDKKIATQILGMLTAKYSYLNNSGKKKEALAKLWEADRSLKQSNLDIRLLLERLIVKLFV